MAYHTKVRPDREDVELCKLLLELCIKTAGGITFLAKDLPASVSHLTAIRKGEALMGGVLFSRCLKYCNLYIDLRTIVEEELDGPKV